MRAAKERKRLERHAGSVARTDRWLGAVWLLGPLAGGPRQMISLWDDGSHRRIARSINGDPPRLTSETELLAMIRRELRRVLAGG